MARCLVAGCGYVGSQLAGLLAGEGHSVWGLRRSAWTPPPGVKPLAADLLRPESLGGLPEGLDLVFYTASAGGGGEAAYRAAYVNGLDNLLGALREHGEGPRVVFTSSTGVYAQEDGSWVDEDSPTEPPHYSGRLLLEGEALLGASGCESVVVRLGGIYGPGRTRLVDAVRAGRARIRSGGPRYTNRIHRDDCAGVLAFVAGLPEPARCYLGVDRDPADEAEVLRWLAARLGAAPPPLGDDEEAASRRVRSNKRCSCARLLEAGYRLRHPTFREGYGALIEAMDPEET